MNRHLLILTTAAAAMGLTACVPPHPHAHHGRESWSTLKTIATLDCPESQGELTRKSAAPDGKSCEYAGPDGAEVSVQLTALTGASADPVLDPIATALRAELPVHDDKAPATATTGMSERDRVDIDLPGVHVHAGGDGARVDAGDGASGVHIDANDHGAEVHVDDRGGPGVSKMLILTSQTPGPHGFRLTGYDARGPAAGPIVIATVKSKSENHDNLFDDVRDLVRHNVGG
jgi:hypothetical protein